MSRTVAMGPPGLEVPHKINGTYGSIVMNVRTARPRTRLTQLKGYYSLPTADNNREPHVGRRGEAIYPGAPRGKTIVYSGELQGRTLESLRELTNTFKKAIAGSRGNELKIQVQDSEVPWFFYARVIDCEIDEEQTNGPTMIWPWTRTFQLSLELSDGRFYVDNGGAAYDSIAAGDGITVDNEGSTDTDPVFIFDAAADTPVELINETLGVKLKLAGMPAGTMTVNFGTREILYDTEDATEFLVEDESDWWDEDQIGIAPGESVIKVVGAVWNLSFYHAWE
jgi:hypothetical protein